jgi:hypothetical protein
MKTILVLAAPSQAVLDNDGASVESKADTLKEAKQRARYYLTADYAKTTEMAEPFGYARVLVDGENVFDLGS